MNKTKKILIGISAAVILIIAACGIAYAVAPRDILQLVMSDSAYAELTLAKNMAELYPDESKAGFDLDGNVKVTFKNNIFGSAKVTEDISEYVNTLKIDSSVDANMRGKVIKGTFVLKDADGAVISTELISFPSAVYLNIDEFGLGWMKLKSETAENNGGAGETEDDETENEEIDDEVQITVNPDKSLTVKMSTEDLAKHITSEPLKNKLKESGISEVKVDFVIDKRNNITEMRIQAPGGKDSFEISAVFDDDTDTADIKLNAEFDRIVDISLTLKAKESEFKEFTVPNADEVSEFNEKQVESAALKYALYEMPRQHKQFAKVYKDLLAYAISEVAGGLSGLYK